MSVIKIGWYVMYTKPRHEKKIAEYLNRLDLQSFLPLSRQLRIQNGKRKYVTIPLFPSYIFVKLNRLQDYFDSLHIPGVLNYLRSANQIAEISEPIIANLKSLVETGGKNVEVSYDKFEQGQSLTIQAGPFKGVSCEVVQHLGKYKMLVRIELLKRNVIIDIPYHCLIAHPSNAFLQETKF